jgi:hypothetical protein
MFRVFVMRFLEQSHLTTLCDDDVLCWLAFGIGYRSGVLNLGYYVHTIDDVAEDDVLAVEVRCTTL